MFMRRVGCFVVTRNGQLPLEGVGGNVAQLLRSIGCRVGIGAARQQR